MIQTYSKYLSGLTLSSVFFISSTTLPAAVIMDLATLSTDFHDVTGTVTVVDMDTLRIDDFTYDGAGIDVYFYLGADNTNTAFTNGLEIGPQLLGTIYDGTQAAIIIDLPTGETMNSYNAISVWCTAASVSFGSGSFAAVPEPTGSALLAFGALLSVFRRRR